MNDTVPERLKAMGAARGWSGEQVARAANITQTAASRVDGSKAAQHLADAVSADPPSSERHARPSPTTPEAAGARMSDGDRLSENLKALRTARGWSQAQVAQASGVTQTALSRLERGVTVRDSMRIVPRLADAFGVSIEQLTSALITTQAAAREAAPKVDPDAVIFQAVKELDLPLQVLDAARSASRSLRGAGVSVGRSEADVLVRTIDRLHREGKSLGETSVLAALAAVALRAGAGG